MLIDYTWREYFLNPHEGTGTTYERFILHQYFERLRKQYSVEKVLECPIFGMTGLSGINSLWWAYNGADVTILDDDEERICMIQRVWQNLSMKAHFACQPDGFKILPFKDNSFDLGWNFASLRFVRDPRKFLAELARVSAKVIFICVPNQGNVWSFLLRLFDGMINEGSSYPANTDLIGIMGKLNWNLTESGYFDVPPWPDIAMKKEDFLKKMGFQKLAQKLEKRDGACLSILDYFNGNNRNMESEMLKHSFLERLPSIFKRYWAHHQYFIFTPNNP